MDKKIVAVENLGNNFKFDQPTKKINVKTGDGITIAADGTLSVIFPRQEFDLSNLPVVGWKKGTSVLVKQDGKLKQAIPNESLFQEVGVGIAASKLSGNTGDTYHVVVTVTNSGEATNELTDLTITKPQLGNYTISNFEIRSSGGQIEKLTDLTYKVKNLKTGGTARVEFDVIPTSVGTFQFGASINPNSLLDLKSNNNSATLTLSASTPADTTYTPTFDCPAIVVKDKLTQKTLLMGGTKPDWMQLRFAGRPNIYLNQPSTIELTTDVDVQIAAVLQNGDPARVYGMLSTSDGRTVAVAADNMIVEGLFADRGRDRSTLAQNLKNDVVEIVNPRLLRITPLANGHNFTLFLKPKSTKNCKWQWVRFVVSPLKDAIAGSVLTTTAPASSVVISNTLTNAVPFTETDYLIVNGSANFTHSIDSTFERSITTATTRVTFKKPGTYQLQSTVREMPNGSYSVGKFKIDASGGVVTVVVAPDVSSTDNAAVRVNGVEFKLEV